MNRILKTICLFIFVIGYISNIPAQLPPMYSVTVNASLSSGYYFFNAIKPGQKPPIKHPPFHMILNHLGELVYFKKFPENQSPSNLELHANGLMSYYLTDKYFLMDKTFAIVDSVYVKNGILKDGHELQILPNGHFVLLGIEDVKMDLRKYKLFSKNESMGSDTATVKCGVVQEQDAFKNVVFEWHSKNAYDFDDIDPFYLSDPAVVDWCHINAIEYDHDGNYLISARNFNEITKVKRSDSTIMWRLGGKRNQFNFTHDSIIFKAQHAIRRIANGNITLYDNGIKGPPLHPSSAKEYKLNEKELKAELVWSYTDKLNSYSSGIGNVKRLGNGNTIINYGMSSNSSVMFNVVTPPGDKVFEIVFKDTLRAYRVLNYTKLPWKIKQPVITCSCNNQKVMLNAEKGHTNYMWSTGAITQSIEITSPGSYSVFVPSKNDGFIASEVYVINDIKAACLKRRAKKMK